MSTAEFGQFLFPDPSQIACDGGPQLWRATSPIEQASMGWKDGLKLILKPAGGEPVSLDMGASSVASKVLANDISGVLHKACRRDPRTVVMTGTSPEAERYVADYLDVQYGLGATAVVVFDGAGYPPKRATQAARRSQAAAYTAQAEEKEKAGKKAEAAKLWAKAATPKEPLRRAVMAHCVRRGIPFIVSPYEADAQLVAVQQDGLADTVLVCSDDSDLPAYGAGDCIYNFDSVRRTGVVVNLLRDVLGKVRPVCRCRATWPPRPLEADSRRAPCLRWTTGSPSSAGPTTAS